MTSEDLIKLLQNLPEEQKKYPIVIKHKYYIQYPEGVNIFNLDENNVLSPTELRNCIEIK